jgi:hypothetical protein
MMLPVQPGMRQRPVGTFAGGAWGMPLPGVTGGAVGCDDGPGPSGIAWGVTEAAAAECAPPGEGMPHTSQ